MKTKSRLLIIAIPLVFLLVVAFLGYLVSNFGIKHASLLHGGKRIGVIRLEGVIVKSALLIKEIKRFRDDRSIGGVVLRINSPGGSVAPSQEIHEEIKKLARKKKVVTSMGSVCASGGYYVAVASHTIFANPGSVTGSIGVIVGFSNLKGLFDKIGIKSYIVKSGRFKDIGTPSRDMTPEDLKVIQDVVDSIYGQFVKTVALDRRLPLEKVKALADGRVFSGTQAKRAGLVDRIGSLEDAITYLAKTIGVHGRPSVIYSKKPGKKLWELLFKNMVGNWASRVLGPAGNAGFYYLWPAGVSL